MGHIGTRAWQQTYASSVHTFAQSNKHAAVVARKQLPFGTSIKFAVRSASLEGAIDQLPWREIEEGVAIPLGDQDRRLQYRATFASDHGDRFGVLERVEVQFAK